MSISLIESKVRPSYFKKQSNLQHKYTGISTAVYFRFLLDLDDDYLTEWEVQKFRILFREKLNQSYWVPAVIFPAFYVVSPKVIGFYIHRVQYNRFLRLYSSAALAVFAYLYSNCYVWPSKSFHEIITQPEPNGKYARSLFSHNYPRTWAKISKDLYAQGYNFREMNEYSEKETMPDVTNKFDNSWY